MITVKELYSRLEEVNNDLDELYIGEWELLCDVNRIKNNIGKMVKHFKGNYYLILDIVEHTETGEELVIYKALYGEYKTYARPIDMFISRVDKVKYPEVEQLYRFELVDSIK